MRALLAAFWTFGCLPAQQVALPDVDARSIILLSEDLVEAKGTLTFLRADQARMSVEGDARINVYFMRQTLEELGLEVGHVEAPSDGMRIPAPLMSLALQDQAWAEATVPSDRVRLPIGPSECWRGGSCINAGFVCGPCGPDPDVDAPAPPMPPSPPEAPRDLFVPPPDCGECRVCAGLSTAGADVASSVAELEALVQTSDRIHLVGGAYALPAPIVIDRPLTLLGDCGLTLLTASGEAAFTVASDDVTIADLDITAVDGAISAEAVDNLHITGVAIDRGASAIVLEGAQGLIEGSTVREARTGIAVGAGGDLDVEGGAVLSADGDAFTVSGSTLTLRNVKVDVVGVADEPGNGVIVVDQGHLNLFDSVLRVSASGVLLNRASLYVVGAHLEGGRHGLHLTLPTQDIRVHRTRVLADQGLVLFGRGGRVEDVDLEAVDDAVLMTETATPSMVKFRRVRMRGGKAAVNTGDFDLRDVELLDHGFGSLVGTATVVRARFDTVRFGFLFDGQRSVYLADISGTSLGREGLSVRSPEARVKIARIELAGIAQLRVREMAEGRFEDIRLLGNGEQTMDNFPFSMTVEGRQAEVYRVEIIGGGRGGLAVDCGLAPTRRSIVEDLRIVEIDALSAMRPGLQVDRCSRLEGRRIEVTGEFDIGLNFAIAAGLTDLSDLRIEGPFQVGLQVQGGLIADGFRIQEVTEGMALLDVSDTPAPILKNGRVKADTVGLGFQYGLDQLEQAAENVQIDANEPLRLLERLPN